MIIAASILLCCENRVLLVKRSLDEGNYAGYWSIPGGRLDEGETAEAAARRECGEEIGYEPASLVEIATTDLPGGDQHVTFRCNLTVEMEPTLNAEHSAADWFEMTSLPKPLHPGVKKVIADLPVKKANDSGRNYLAATFALDKDSVRTVDADGRLHVKIAHISKACVNPYRGVEIPGWEELGLDADKIYKMFRDPDELAAGAATSNNIQLLDDHVAVNAENPEKMRTVGSTGTDAAFNSPYLDNSLVIWDREAIDRIASGEQRELSCSYRYAPDMGAGTFEGAVYDGVMRDIQFNHVAIVSKGRAGPDVVVGDSASSLHSILEIDMPKAKLPSRTASRVGAALGAYLIPLLAKDKVLDLASIVAPLTYKNLLANDGKTFKPDAIKKIAQLARDAAMPMIDPTVAATAGGAEKAIGPDDVIMKLVEHAIAGAAPAEIEADVGDPTASTVDPVDPTAVAGDPNAELMAFLSSLGLDEGALAKIKAMLAKKEGTADPVDPVKKPDATEADDDPAKQKAKDDAMPANAVTTTAMDAAIKKARDETTATIKAEMTAIAEAREFVRGWVGAISLAHDSVNGVYKATLKALGIDADKVNDTEALRLLIESKPKPSDRPVRAHDSSQPAYDADVAASLAKRFPGAAAITLS